MLCSKTTGWMPPFGSGRPQNKWPSEPMVLTVAGATGPAAGHRTPGGCRMTHLGVFWGVVTPTPLYSQNPEPGTCRKEVIHPYLPTYWHTLGDAGSDNLKSTGRHNLLILPTFQKVTQGFSCAPVPLCHVTVARVTCWLTVCYSR